MASMSCKRIWTALLQLCMVVCFGPLLLVYYFILKCKLAQQMRAIRPIVDSNQNFPGNHSAADGRKYDYLKTRGMDFIHQVTWGNFQQVLKYAGSQCNVNVIPTHILHHALFNTSLSLRLQEDDRSNIKWRFPFDVVDDEESDFDVREILIHNCGSLVIVDRKGKIHTPRDRTWPLAKAHVQRQLSFLAPVLNVDELYIIVAEKLSQLIEKSLPMTSPLRQLLEPHISFAGSTYQLFRNTSDGNSHQPSDHFLPPKPLMPIFDKSFAQSMRKERKKLKNLQDFSHCDFNDEIAYHAFLKEYLEVVKHYVTSLEPHLKDDYKKLMPHFKQQFPQLKSEDQSEFLSTIIWQSAVVHYCNSATFYNGLANEYCCTVVRTPLVSKGDSVSIDIGESVGKKINTRKTSYLRSVNDHLFVKSDICKTKCFMDTYAIYKPSKIENTSLMSTKYNFMNEDAQKSSANFSRDLCELNSKLKQRGEALVDANHFINTICF